ncbi:MAG: hypothetical protein ABSE55_16285 [Terracidiphilus sp.]|jgi:hypothetical protein
MDVHPPHAPIHSVKEFMVHLLAITIGLLIALGLEGSVEWLHHRHLARDARENIFQEIRANQGDALRQLNALPAEEKRLDEILSQAEDAQHGRTQKPIGGFTWTSVLLRDSAWKAASSTGAIAYMDYDEVKGYSQLYDVQKLLISFQERYFVERHEMNVLLEQMQVEGKISDAEFESGKRAILSAKLTARELNELDNVLNDSYTKALSQAY